MKTDLSSYDNSWYKPGSKVKRLLWYLISVVFIQSSWNASSGLKIFLLRSFGARIGTGVVIKPRVTIKYPWKLTIGDHCWIGEQVWIDNLDEVILESHVCLSQGSMLQCGNHNYTSSSFDLMIAPIHVKEGAWIGAKSCVGPGVIVESHAVLSMGSVAAKHLEAYGIYSGNPAAKVKTREIKT